MDPDESTTRTAEAGVRTFLIADVRGYTRYTQERGDEAAAQLATAFADVVQTVVGASGGRLVELRGDEALVVFDSPRAGIRTAVALQHAFVERATAADVPLNVGIGLDAGEAVPVGDGYRGGALNLAARLCGLAGPGEVLVSESLAHLARKVDDMPYVDRGRVAVKGLSERLRIYRVEFPLELPADEGRPHRPRKLAVLTGLTVALIATVGIVVALLVTGFSGSEAPSRIEADALAAIDGDGGLTSETPVGRGPNAVAFGLGSLWVANAVDGTVSRVSPGRDERPVIRVAGTPGGIAAGEGSVWVSDATGRTLSQISSDSNTVVRDDISIGNGAGAVAVGEGAVWVANILDYTVSRVDPDRGLETDMIRVAGRPDAVAVGAGAVWVASGDTATVSKIDPAMRVVVQTIPVGNGARAIAVDGEAVWVANALDGTVSKISAATGAVMSVGIVAPGVASIAASRGAVWVASPTARKLFRLDPDDVEVSDSVDMGSSPSALTVAPDGTVWATALPPATSHRGGTLVVSAFLSGCNCVDPAFAWQADAWRALSVLYDGLVAYRKTGGAAGATLVPDLAVNLPTPTDGGRTYRFRLRDGVRYSDGTLVRASDFRASIERLLRLNGVSFPNFYSRIVGAPACSADAVRCDLAEGIEVDDGDGTVTIHLTEPDPDLLAKLALPFAFVLPRGAPEPDRPITDLEDFDTVGTYRIPGTGPYVTASFDPQRELRLERNPHFRVFAPDAQPDGYPDRIVIRILGDGNAGELRSAVRDVERGMADWSTYLTPPEVKRLAVEHAAQLHATPLGAVQYLMLNTRTRPFSDVNARRALATALDRDRIVALAGGDLVARPACQFLPPTIPGYRPYCPYSATPSAGIWVGPDVEKARRLANTSRTRGERVVIAIPPDNPNDRPLATYVADVLTALGYRAEVRVEEDIFAAMLEPDGEADVTRLGWVKDYAAASNFIEPLFTCNANEENGLNISQFCSEQLDALVARASATNDPAEAVETWSRIDRLLVDEAPAVPLYTIQQADYVSERVGNYVFNPEFGVLLDQMWVE